MSARPLVVRRRAGLLAGLLTLSAGVTGIVVTATPASAAPCTDVDVSFARGTGEPQGLGILGGPFASAVAANLPGLTVSTYAVVYDANSAQTSAAPGSTNLTNHIISVAAACPSTRFVVGGYSQGATVVSKSLGIQTGSGGGTPIPAALASRVSAAVVFGNPLGLQRQTIATASSTYGPRSRDYCASGDPVCGGGFNFAAHLAYRSNGNVPDGARFAADLVRSTTPVPTTPPSTPPTTTPTTPPTTPPSTSIGRCVRSSTSEHVSAGRATEVFSRAYAKGSRDSLGYVSRFNSASVRETSPGFWEEVSSC